jgi:hypothetical protein
MLQPSDGASFNLSSESIAAEAGLQHAQGTSVLPVTRPKGVVSRSGVFQLVSLEFI